MPEDDALGLAPIVMASGVEGGRNEGRADPERALEIGGVKIAVPTDFDPGHLGRVIAAIRGAS